MNDIAFEFRVTGHEPRLHTGGTKPAGEVSNALVESGDRRWTCTTSWHA